MTDFQFNRLCEKQDTTNHLLEDICDILGTISEQLRNKQTDDQEAQEAFDDMLNNPMQQIDGIWDCIGRSFGHRAGDTEKVNLWADDLAERSVW